MKFCANIHGPKMMNPNDFGDLFTSDIVPLLDQFSNRWFMVKYLQN